MPHIIRAAIKNHVIVINRLRGEVEKEQDAMNALVAKHLPDDNNTYDVAFEHDDCSKSPLGHCVFKTEYHGFYVCDGVCIFCGKKDTNHAY